MVRKIIFGDVNENYKALNSLLRQSSSLSVEGYVCHGDVPNKPWRFNLEATQRCVELLDDYRAQWTLANHEKEILANAEELEIPPSLADRLRNLPEELIIGEVVVKHSSPEGMWRIARRHSEFDYLQEHYPQQRIVVFGHSHRRCHHRTNGGKIDSTLVRFDEEYDVSEGLHLVNTGAMHRLASFDWSRGYVMYDSDKQIITFKKVR